MSRRKSGNFTTQDADVDPHRCLHSQHPRTCAHWQESGSHRFTDYLALIGLIHTKLTPALKRLLLRSCRWTLILTRQAHESRRKTSELTLSQALNYGSVITHVKGKTWHELVRADKKLPPKFYIIKRAIRNMNSYLLWLRLNPAPSTYFDWMCR